MSSGIRVAVVTKGHPFEGPAFFEVFDANDGIVWTHVEHPEALELVEPDRAADFDVLVMYDMPGIRFTGANPPAEFPAPPEGYPEQFRALLDRGMGMVFLHHAVAGWPAWEEYGDIVGGRFLYQPATVHGVDFPDSGYRHQVTHTVEVLEPAHPICDGIEPTFEITDELYLSHVFEDDVEPLMRSTYDFVDSNFYSADRAIRGTRNDSTGWSHPPGSDLVAWTKTVGRSPIVYLQFGDDAQTYADPTYRRILANAIEWAAVTSE